MSDYSATQWVQADNTKAYCDTAEFFIQERRTMIQVMASLYRYFFRSSDHIRILDLGCGDGILGETLLGIDPEIDLVCVDGSSHMLKAARQKLAGYQNTDFYQKTFKELIEQPPQWKPFSLIVSSLAIHHLVFYEKEALFRRLYSLLESDGFFLNIDVILPDHMLYEDWYYKMWREWIANHGMDLSEGESYIHIPEKARKNTENHFDKLPAQLDALRDAGYSHVECYYKYGLFSVYGGRRL